MTVARICHREVDTADPTESVRTAAQRMRSRQVGSLVILDEERRPIGILTDRDVALRAIGAGMDVDVATVGEVMTPAPRSVSELAAIEDALTLMRSNGVRRMPVVTPAGALVGVVSLDDVVCHLAEELGQIGRLIRGTSPEALATR